jgi:hypothetical protein
MMKTPVEAECNLDDVRQPYQAVMSGFRSVAGIEYLKMFPIKLTS